MMGHGLVLTDLSTDNIEVVGSVGVTVLGEAEMTRLRVVLVPTL